MPRTTYKIDQGINFGTWDDPTSRYLYHDSTKEILKRYPGEITNKISVADYGGGNGMIKTLIPWITTIDHDQSKNPDICDDILTHNQPYDLIIMRYVLHYLSDQQIIRVIKQMKAKELIIQNFCNYDLDVKQYNSQNETKIFRTPGEILTLLNDFEPDVIYWERFFVTKQFYRNRLNHSNPKGHSEIMLGLRINLKNKL